MVKPSSQLSLYQRFRQNTVVDALIDVFDWYPKHYSPTEVTLVKKLDRTLLIIASASFMSNLTNAYVSGMETDVQGMGGNALNYAVMVWTGAYVVGQIPGLLMQSRPNLAPYFLPSIEILWAILTFAQSRVTKAWHVYLLRALLGLTEAPVFGCVHFLIGSWYTKEETFKRAGTWFTCNYLGTMISGYLQTAALNNLDGVGGLAAWRFLYILDGIITVPIAIAGFALFPGLPSSKKPWFLTTEEHELASTRLGEGQRVKAEKITVNTFKRTLKMPLWWICVTIYICVIQSSYWVGYMSLWLKSEPTKYSVQDRNTLPTFQYIISAFASWFATSLGTRVSVITLFSIGQVFMFVALIVLIVWTVPDGLKFMAFYFAGASGLTSPVLYSWLNNTIRSDPEARAIIIGSMMTIGYSTQIWIPLLVYPTVEAPVYPKGYPSSLGFLIGLWILFVFAVVYFRRLSARKIDLEASPVSSPAQSISEDERTIAEKESPSLKEGSPFDDSKAVDGGLVAVNLSEKR